MECWSNGHEPPRLQFSIIVNVSIAFNGLFEPLINGGLIPHCSSTPILQALATFELSIQPDRISAAPGSVRRHRKL